MSRIEPSFGRRGGGERNVMGLERVGMVPCTSGQVPETRGGGGIAAEQKHWLRVSSLYCDESLGDHDTAYPENGTFHSRKGHSRGSQSWATPKVLADITAATLSINELGPAAKKVPYPHPTKQPSIPPKGVSREALAECCGQVEDAALDISRLSNTYPEDCSGRHPVFAIPVYHQGAYPFVCHNRMPQSGQHLGYPQPYNKLMMHPSGYYYAQRYCNRQKAFWAFRNLPSKISWSFAGDSANFPRSELAGMAKIEIEREQEHLSLPSSAQSENHALRRERCRAIRWISQRCTYWGLNRHTLFLAVAYLDKYILNSGVSSGSLMLKGCACLSLACKMEEVVHPSPEEFCEGLGINFRVKEFREQMYIIVKRLDWKLHVPNIYSFLKLFILHANVTNEVQAWAMYLAELCMMDASTLLYHPSVAAIACLTVALARCNAIDWRETPDILQQYLEPDTFAQSRASVHNFIFNLIQLQHEAVQQGRHDPNHYLRPVVERFRSEKMCFVAELEAFDGNFAMILSWDDA